MRKKIYFSIIAFMVTLAVGAQTREYIDLGFPSGTLWATCNVGANSPEEFGDHFAWGETEPKEHFSWDNYKWVKPTSNGKRFSKYVPYIDVSGFTDGKRWLLPEDDAATANWGSEWRTPTYDQMRELIDNTTSEMKTVNGRRGLVLTSKKNRKSIFFPGDNQQGIGIYWNINIITDGGVYDEARVMFFSNTTHVKHSYYQRYRGFSIRPVRAKVATSIVEVTDNQKATKSRKYISGGNLVIVKDGKKYNANGIEIK